MTSSFNCRLGFVFILHVWIISCAKLVNSHEHSAVIVNSGLYLYNNDDILALTLSNATNLPQDTFLELKEVYKVQFSGKNITTIPVNVFQYLGGLTNLEEIYFLELNVIELPGKLFSNLTSIRYIFIAQNNKLQTLPPLLFNGLMNLKEIHLHYNGLSTLSRQQFGNLINLQEVQISSSPLRGLSADLFKGSTNLKHIAIANCSLTSLPNELFRGLINLSEVYLDYNKLTELPEDLFQGLEALKWIQITNNQLISLPERIFSNLRNLRFLRVDHNKLTQLSPNLFKGLELDTLVLSNNNLTVLPQNVLQLVQEGKAFIENF